MNRLAAALVVTAMAGTLAMQASSAEPPLVGRATVVDGDTIEIGGTRIRLHAIDAPEGNQKPHGPAAAWALDGYLAASRPTRCEPVDTDRWGRVVAKCFRSDGQDVQRWLVQQGHALPYLKYGGKEYAPFAVPVEYQPPWEWRKK